MNRKLAPIFVLLTLILATIACGGGGSTPEPTNTSAPAEPPAPTNTPEPPPAPETVLGEEQRSDYGGFAFQALPGYTVEEAFGFASMEAPDADPEIGPAVLLMGGPIEESTTAEQLFDDFVNDIEVGVEVSEPWEVTVGGVPGLAADIGGTAEGKEVAGRVVFVAVPPTQSFTVFGVAPPERWDDELAPLFDAVMDSVSFFEPTTSSELGEEEGEEIRQWAISAVASSEYSNPDWAATQATGAPDTIIEECADLPTAWASLEPDTVEWIELGYDIPVYPTEVNIIQTHSPDQVLFVDLLDIEGEYHGVYLGEPEDKSDECPYTLSIPVEEADYQVVGIKITIDQSEIPAAWNEIDAVELVGYPAADTEPSAAAPTSPPPTGITPDNIPAGDFSYEITGADEDKTVSGGIIQDQSTTVEYIIGLISEDTRYALTLFLPRSITPGQFELEPYQPVGDELLSAAIYIGVRLYTADSGTLTVESVDGDTITGSIVFTATDENDATKTITVVGAFNQIPPER